MKRLLVLVLITSIALVQIAAVEKATKEFKTLPTGAAGAFAIPSKMAKLTALEFDGIVADFFYLRALAFLGSTKERQETPRVKPWEWKWYVAMMHAVTDLDPYFYDPYYVANAYLPWEAGMVREANELLEKGARNRYWDSTLPFYIGFNWFYFLHDNIKASEWLMTAARRPGSNSMYASLAARLSYEGNRLENAVLFLKELVQHTDDEDLMRKLETRLEAMTNLLAVEKAAGIYKRKFGKMPDGVKALVQTKILNQVPEDPYGGKIYIDRDGTVRTTSDLKYRDPSLR